MRPNLTCYFYRDLVSLNGSRYFFIQVQASSEYINFYTGLAAAKSPPDTHNAGDRHQIFGALIDYFFNGNLCVFRLRWVVLIVLPRHEAAQIPTNKKLIIDMIFISKNLT